ncbi:carbon storage regulator CsrA [Oceanobacillus bengalensis]|uniref:Translational regulator CsrA n=1 Tax=Oceanobacillus bengalensis TaxID=1435466 RepID=A0A494Z6M2_9BACI|nr:carbon storage regulator CsrA [Oceanobacillus bengalensis]RKQ18220.1 carbon storage regulator [Oceanobacillus bengalensis]
MLILSRKTNEAIQIGDDIEIKVISVEGDQVKLGISAPKSIEIYRKEIYTGIEQQNSEAANINLDVIKLLNDTNKL